MADATTAIKSIRGFEMVKKGRMALVSRWVSALITLFSVEIERLILERDQKIAQLIAEMGSRELLMNSRKQNVLTECKINLMVRLSDHLSVVNS
jgi:hypothetical protein